MHDALRRPHRAPRRSSLVATLFALLAAQGGCGSCEAEAARPGDAGAVVDAGPPLNPWPVHSEESLAILVSCVGRKLVMGDAVDEEVEAVGEILGAGCVLAGFYSNGEIGPYGTTGECRLHNQTMTILRISES